MCEDLLVVVSLLLTLCWVALVSLGILFSLLRRFPNLISMLAQESGMHKHDWHFKLSLQSAMLEPLGGGGRTLC